MVLPVGQIGNTVPMLTLKIPRSLKAEIAAAAKARFMTQSEFVREAIEKSLREPPVGQATYDLIADLILDLPHGKGPPTDRSTNKKWLEGFGLDGPAYRKKLGLPDPRTRSKTRKRRT
jgi:hypothetical protein